MSLPDGFDAGNTHLLGVQGDSIHALIPLPQHFTRARALNLIAWLTVLGGFTPAELEAARREVSR